MKRSARIALALAALSFAPRSHAGAWIPDPGSGYFKLWFKWLPGFGYRAGNEQTYDVPAYHELFLSAYGEVGLFRRVSLALHAPLVQTFHLYDPRASQWQSHVSPGDPTLSVRVQLLRTARIAMSAEAFVRVPIARTGVVQEVYSPLAPYDRVGGLQVGAGSIDAGGNLSVGATYGRLYVQGTLGALGRTLGYDPVLTFTGEAGGRLKNDRIGMRARITAFLSLQTGSAPRHESPSGIGNGTRYWGFALEADYRVTERWYAGVTLEGGAGPVIRQIGGPVISLYAAASF